MFYINKPFKHFKYQQNLDLGGLSMTAKNKIIRILFLSWGILVGILAGAELVTRIGGITVLAIPVFILICATLALELEKNLSDFLLKIVVGILCIIFTRIIAGFIMRTILFMVVIGVSAFKVLIWLLGIIL